MPKRASLRFAEEAGMNTDPIYEADGKISVRKAVPFGLQHVLAMFVANIAPILIVTGVVKMPASEAGAVVQAAMIIAGIGSLLQMYPFFRLGSGLPVIMGISFTFVSVFCVIGLKYGYGAILGAVLIGGVLEGILGLGAAWWRKLVPPIVSATVVTAIGFSLLPIGANSFGGGFGHPEFGDARFLIVGTVTLVSCLIFNIHAKSFYKQLSVLFGLFVGYVTAYFYGMVDLGRLTEVSLVSLPVCLILRNFIMTPFSPYSLFSWCLPQKRWATPRRLPLWGSIGKRKTGKYPAPLPWMGLFLPCLLSSGVCRLHLSARMWGLSP